MADEPDETIFLDSEHDPEHIFYDDHRIQADVPTKTFDSEDMRQAKLAHLKQEYNIALSNYREAKKNRHVYIADFLRASVALNYITADPSTSDTVSDFKAKNLIPELN